MLPKRKRINKALFQEIIKKGNVIHSPFFIFRYIKQKTAQYAFVAPKSVGKSAVLRGKLRRTGYNCIKTLNLPFCAGIFFYKKTATNQENAILKADILSILGKI